MNIQKGAQRLWVVVSGFWTARIFLFFEFDGLLREWSLWLVPIGLGYGLMRGIIWVIQGFKQDS